MEVPDKQDEDNVSHKALENSPVQLRVMDASSSEVMCWLWPLPTWPTALTKPESVKYGFQPVVRFAVARVSPKGVYWMVGDILSTVNWRRLAMNAW
jgi:hypothetical protein